MCAIAGIVGATQAAGPVTRPTRIRPVSELADRDIADDESLDRVARIAARRRLGIPDAENADDDLFPTTDAEIKAGQVTKFEKVRVKPNPKLFKSADPAVISARQKSLEKLFPSSTPARIGIPGFSGRGIPGFSGSSSSTGVRKKTLLTRGSSF